MKILREVDTLEIKRAFVIADHLTQGKNRDNNQAFLKDISEKQFKKNLRATKEKVLAFPENKLDALITPKRLTAYNNSTWYIAEAHPQELGVWTRAGNLPLRWTNDSLKETARKVAAGFKKKSKLLKKRPRHAIPNILEIKTHLNQKEKYLYPIVFKTDTGTGGRRRLKRKMKGDIDDGCMRSIALAISGRDPITIYFGVPKKSPSK